MPNNVKQWQTIKVEKNDSLVTVTLNRPDVRNAFHPLMIQELTELFKSVLPIDVDCRTVVLQGAGKSFCSGADLGWMQSMVDFSMSENIRDSENLFAMFKALREFPLPLVGRVHGHAMGGALGLIAVCDIVAAVTGTQFCFSEVRLGLAPAVISPFVLEKMSAGWAHRWFLTGDVFSAEQALQSGLVHFCGTETEVTGFVSGVLKSFAESGPDAVRATKGLLRFNCENSDWLQREFTTTRAIAERRMSPEGQEGLRGFLEKRTPAWKNNTPAWKNNTPAWKKK